MAKKKAAAREFIKLKSAESSHFYVTQKNRKNSEGKLEVKKYDPVLRRHVVYKETKLSK